MTAATLPQTERVDYVALIAGAATDRALRRRAQATFREAVENGLLLHDEGANPRISDVGRCSLEFVTALRAMHEYDRTLDERLFLLDQGTLSGAWNAALLAAALPGCVALEAPVALRGVPGHVDALVRYNMHEIEPVEFKLTQSGGQLRSPKDSGKLYQIVQAAMYADAIAEQGAHAPAFTIITSGPNAGNNKYGVPYPKMRADRYYVADYRNEIDGELERLQRLGALDGPDSPLPAADAKDAWRCVSCGFAECARNRNPQRLLL